MTSRGKRLVSLVIKNNENYTDILSTANESPVREILSTSSNTADIHEFRYSVIADDSSMFPAHSNTLIESMPSCSNYQEGKYNNDDVENELESLFGDVSDTDDPTYHLPGYPRQLESCNVDSNSLVTLEDLLGNKENASVQYFEMQEIIQNNIEVLEQNKVQHQDMMVVVEEILTELVKRAWLLIEPAKRWRKSNPNSWTRNLAKKRRADGLPYKIKAKSRPAKVPKQIDCSACQYKCCDAFDMTTRHSICRYFWNLDFMGRKNFILSNVTILLPKRILSVRNRQRPERKYTKKCHFTKQNEQIQVCQKFFCCTLNISPAVITDAVQKRNDLNCFDGKDHRGAHEPVNKTRPDIIQGIRKHIESFPCMDAHYCRKNTKRKYLDKNLNIRKMHLLYKDECLKNDSEPASEITYRRTFSKEYNLSFFVPRKDQCLICTNYAQAKIEKKKELEDNYKAHQERKKICNNEKEKDKIRSNADEEFSSLTFDLQAVLQIPSCDVGLLYYSRKLCVYNLTIYEAALPNNAYCFSWSEVNGRKGSSEIGTILLHYLTYCVPENVKEISLFSDTCGGQNRNQYVAALLLWAVQKIDHLKVIEQKFLESGHTQMEADSMHSSIESARKNNSVFAMMDWISIFKRARRKQTVKVDGKKIIREAYRVKEFKYDEFFDLKHLANTIMKNRTKDEKGKQVQWLKIKRIRYVKGEDRKIFFNYDMSDNFNVLELRENSSTSTFENAHAYSTRNKKRPTENLAAVNFQLPEQLNRLYQEHLKISEAKKKDLITLCNKLIIPEELHGWYKDLKTDKQVVDKLPEPAIDEVEGSEDE